MNAREDGPCDKCGKDTGCTCGPCPCRWCSYDRGEGTAHERALVEANIKAHRMADQRQARRIAEQQNAMETFAL